VLADKDGRKENSAAPAFSVSLVSGSGWRLVPPASVPQGLAPVDATYRLVLDDSGRVSRVLPPGREVPAGLDRFLSSLAFERQGGAAPARVVDVRIVIR